MIRKHGLSLTANLSSSGPLGETYRTTKIPDQFELYDLTNDPTESKTVERPEG